MDKWLPTPHGWCALIVMAVVGTLIGLLIPPQFGHGPRQQISVSAWVFGIGACIVAIAAGVATMAAPKRGDVVCGVVAAGASGWGLYNFVVQSL